MNTGIVMRDLADNLRAAVARFKIANGEGDPIFSAGLPDAEKALAAHEALVRALSSSDEGGRSRDVATVEGVSLVISADGESLEDVIEVLEDALHRIRDLHWTAGEIKTDDRRGTFAVAQARP